MGFRYRSVAFGAERLCILIGELFLSGALRASRTSRATTSRTSEVTMDAIPEGVIPPTGPANLADVRAKLATALRAFSASQSAVPDLEAALTAGRAPSGDLLAELDRAWAALAEAA